MRKILVLCLSVAMLIGLMPVANAATTATIPANIGDEGITFEAEDYPSVYVYSTSTSTYTLKDATSSITADSTSSGSKYLKLRPGKANQKAYYELPVNVVSAGNYILEMRVNRNQTFSLVNGRFAINGEETALVRSSTEAGEWEVYLIPAVFKSGSNTIRFMGETGSSDFFLNIDYIKVCKSPNRNISQTGTTRFEGEHLGAYQTVNGEKKAMTMALENDNTLSNGKYITTSYLKLSGTNPYITVDIPITVPKTGYYDIESKLQYYFSGTTCLSPYSILLDGEAVESYANESSAVWAVKSSRFVIDKGDHILTIKSLGPYAQSSMIIDYVDITPHTISVSPEKETLVEAEDYPYATGVDNSGVTNIIPAVTNPSNISADTLAAFGEYSGNGFVYASRGSSTYKSAKWEIPFIVSAAGVYKITARVLQSNTYWGHTKVYVDGTVFGNEIGGGNPPAFDNHVYSAILAEGEHTITVENTINTINVMLGVDCIKFEPLSTSDPSALLTVTPPDSFVAGEKVTVSYEYSGTNDEGDSILRLVYKDGGEWKESSFQNVKSGTVVEIELPDSLIGKELAIELIPVDSQGNYGGLEQVNLGVLKRDYNLTPYGAYNTERELMANTYGRSVAVSWIDDGNGGGYAQAKNRYENWEFFTPIDIPVVPGEIYDISFDAKVEDGKTNSIGFYTVYKEGTGGAPITSVSSTGVTSQWKTFNVTVTNTATDTKGNDLTGDFWTAGIRLINDQHENYLYIDNVVVRPRMLVDYDWDNYFNERWGEMEPLDSDDGFVDEIAEDGTAYKAFYVDSASGSDSNSGTSESAPLKTIAKAKELVQPYLKDMTGHIYVYIKGSHNLTDTITWGVNDSGQNGYNVIYTKWGDAQPEITMKEDFSGFTLHDSEKNIWKVYIGKDNPARQVYINGVRGVRARTDTTESQKDLLINPKRIGNLYSTECGYLCENMEFANFTNQEDIELVFTEQWTSKRGKVKQIYKVNDKTVRIDLQDKSWQHVVGSAVKNIDPGAPTWIENAYELLDVKGEWYINKKDGYLYYMPRDFEKPETMVATIPVGEHAFVVAGTSVDEKVHNIVFDNLAIKYTTWLHPNLYGVNDSQNNFLELYDGDGRLTGGKEDGAVIIADAAFVDVRNCTLAHMGGGGIFYREVFQGCEVTGNHIYDMSGTAVNMGLTTWENKDFYKYIRTTKYKNYLINNKINNNLIHDVGIEYRSASAVSVSYVMNTEIKYNEIYNSSYSAIHLGGGMDTTSHGRITALQNVDVMYNYVHDIMNDLVYDGGCFYVFGHCGGECTVAYNYFENQRNFFAPLYFDTGTDMWQVHNNVIDLSEVPTWAGGNRVGERSASGWMANGPFFGEADRLGKVYDNYSTTDYVTVNTPQKPSDKYEAPMVYESGAWPAEAQSIIDGAGLESEYLAEYEDSVQRIRIINEEQDYYFLDVGKTLTLDVTGYYRKLNEASSVDISFYSSNEDVAKVNSSGVITATGNGKCGIYAEVLDGDVVRRQNINVVVGDSVQEIKCDTSLISLFTGKTFDLKVTAKTKYGQTVTVTPTVTFDTAGIATVSNGVLTAKAEGNTVAHVTYTSGDVTLRKDIPLYVVSDYNRGSTTTAYISSSTKITSGDDFLNASNWTGNVTASGTGLAVKGTTHDYMPAYYKNKLTSLISFNMTINDPMSWPSIFLKAKDLSKDHQDGYMITFKEDTVELHRFENGERTTIFGESKYNPIGGAAFTNSYKSFLWTSKYYEYGTSVKVTVGTIDEADGVRIILCIKDKPVFDYLDREGEYLKGDGYFGIYEWAGNFKVAPY